MENYDKINKAISEILNTRNNHLKLLTNGSTFLSNKFSFLFGIDLKKEEHSQSNCQTLYIQNYDDCKYVVNQLEVENFQLLLSKLNSFASSYDYPFYLKICFRNKTNSLIHY